MPSVSSSSVLQSTVCVLFNNSKWEYSSAASVFFNVFIVLFFFQLHCFTFYLLSTFHSWFVCFLRVAHNSIVLLCNDTKGADTCRQFPTTACCASGPVGPALRGCATCLCLELRSHYVVQSWGRRGSVSGGVGGTFGPQDSPSPSPEHVWRGV